MEKLTTEKRAAILRCLIEGSSVASTTRITGTCKEAILKLLADAGEACSEYQSEKMVNLPCKLLQMDELHSFVGCHEKNKAGAVNEHPGDVWTWTSLCADTKIIPSWRVGDRSARTAYDYCADLCTRFSGRLQITTDGAAPYKWAILDCFGAVDYAMLVKIYGKDEAGNDAVIGISKRTIKGQPDADKISTSYIERSNLTVRMSNRRYTRRTNAFSKKLENHCHMLAVTFMSYNFCRKHLTLGTAPAVEAGVSDKIMRMEEVVEIIDGYCQRKTNAAFEAAFAARMTAPRTGPTTHEPVKLTPWYLDARSGGPNPPAWQRKPGIKYQD